MMFYAIGISVDENGNGPEMDLSKVFKTDWEVWDQSCLCVHRARDEQSAREIAEDLNVYWMKINGP